MPVNTLTQRNAAVSAAGPAASSPPRPPGGETPPGQPAGRRRSTYFQHAADVEMLEPYLIGAICNASRNSLRRSSTSKALFCGEAAVRGDAG